MAQIRTIDDLGALTSEEVEDVRSSIKLKDFYYQGARQMGRQTGLTLSEYEAWKEKEPTEECRSCHGTGLWKKPERSVGTIHASSAHTCRRRLYYDVMADHAPKSDFRPELLITFAIGHAIHDVVQKALHVALPGKFRDEVRVDNVEAFVSNSRTDGVVELPQARVLLEIKSIGKEFDKLTKPKADHINQAVGIYAHSLGVPFISFLYVSKAWPYPVKEFVVPYDSKIYRRWWRKKGSKVDESIESGIPPIADADKNTCNQCPYNYFCDQRFR
jgi:CRISPR/Cas system-associated exonuclease Cas4 (RecB family)